MQDDVRWMTEDEMRFVNALVYEREDRPLAPHKHASRSEEVRLAFPGIDHEEAIERGGIGLCDGCRTWLPCLDLVDQDGWPLPGGCCRDCFVGRQGGRKGR